MEYISTNKSAVTVSQMIGILSEYDKDTPMYIVDDNDQKRPILDIAVENNKKEIIICDF